MQKILFLIGIFNCLLFQQITAQIFPNASGNKRYTKIRLPTAHIDSLSNNYQSDRLLKITPPLWKIELDTIYNDSFPKENTQSLLYKEAALEWHWIPFVPSNCLESKREDCLYFRTEKNRDMKKKILFSAQDSFKIVEVKRRTQNGKLEWVEDEFPKLEFKEKQAYQIVAKNDRNKPIYIKVKGGMWTEWKEITCRTINPDIVCYQLQHALKERGYYKGALDNRFNDELRTAMMRFRQDENLAVCGDDLGRIVRALGIEY